MPRGRKKTTGETPVKKRKVRKKKSTFACVECGADVERSKFSTNQKYCKACARQKKLNRIKAKNKLKRQVASISKFAKFIKDEEKVNLARKKIAGAGISERWRYFKTNYPKYVDSLR